MTTTAAYSASLDCPFAWQGWTIRLPGEWNPVKLDGDFDGGYVLIADLHGPRLALRWTTPKRGFDLRLALAREVGRLQSHSARRFDLPLWSDTLLCLESDSPGRDVFVGRSDPSHRVLQIVAPRREDEPSQTQALLESLGDGPPGQPRSWAALDLSCKIGGDWRLESHQFNAGDLSLHFQRKRERITIRQLALAHLALRRRPLEQWMDSQDHRSVKTAKPLTVHAHDGRVLQGFLAESRSRHFIFRRPTNVRLALHDIQRDRLLFIEASSASQAAELAQTIGWKHTKASIPCGR